MDEIPEHDPTNRNPVLLIIGWNYCLHSRRAYDSLPQLKDALLEFDSDLRLVIHVTEMLCRIESEHIPRCLEFFVKWSPCVMYINGDVWNQAIQDDTYVIREGCFVMNGELRCINERNERNEQNRNDMNWLNSSYIEGEYEFRSLRHQIEHNPENIIRWLKSCNMDVEVKYPEE